MRTFTLKGWDAKAFEDNAYWIVLGAVVVVSILAVLAWSLA